MTAYNHYLQMKAITESCQDHNLGNAIMEGYTAIYESVLTESIKDKLLSLFKKSTNSDDKTEKKECAQEGKEIMRNVNDAKLGKGAKALLTTIAMGILLSAGSAQAANLNNVDGGSSQPQMELSDDDPAVHNNNKSTGYDGHNPRNAVASTVNNGVKYVLYSNNDMSATFTNGTTITVHPTGNVDVCNEDGSGIVGGSERRDGSFNARSGSVVDAGCQDFDDYNGTGRSFADVHMKVNDASHQDYVDFQKDMANKFAQGNTKGHTHAGDKIWKNLNHINNVHGHALEDILDGINHTYKVDGKTVDYAHYLKAAQDNADVAKANKILKAHPHSQVRK